MKKILLLMIIPMIFGACNKEIVEREPIPSISEGERYRTLTEALIGEHKIRPKDKNNLYIHSVVDSTSLLIKLHTEEKEIKHGCLNSTQAGMNCFHTQ